jgi:hypothetical protein
MNNHTERVRPWDGYGKTHLDEMEPAPPARGSLAERMREAFIAPMSSSAMTTEHDAAYRTNVTATNGRIIAQNLMDSVVALHEHGELHRRRHPELAEVLGLIEGTFAAGATQDLAFYVQRNLRRGY